MGDECGDPAAIQKVRFLISKALPPAFKLRRKRFQPLECLPSPFKEKAKEELDPSQPILCMFFLTPGISAEMILLNFPET